MKSFIRKILLGKTPSLEDQTSKDQTSRDESSRDRSPRDKTSKDKISKGRSLKQPPDAPRKPCNKKGIITSYKVINAVRHDEKLARQRQLAFELRERETEDFSRRIRAWAENGRQEKRPSHFELPFGNEMVFAKIDQSNKTLNSKESEPVIKLAPTEFYLFESLCIELRDKVYDYLIEERMIVGAAYAGSGGTTQLNRLIAKPYTPVLLHAFPDARRFALRLYTAVESSKWLSELKIYVNFKLDTFLCAKFFGDFQPLIPQCFPTSFTSRIQHLVIDQQTCMRIMLKDDTFIFRYPKPLEEEGYEMIYPPDKLLANDFGAIRLSLTRYRLMEMMDPREPYKIYITDLRDCLGHPFRGAYSRRDIDTFEDFNPLSRYPELQTISVIGHPIRGMKLDFTASLAELLPKMELQDWGRRQQGDDCVSKWRDYLERMEIRRHNQPDQKVFELKLRRLKMDWSGIRPYGELYDLPKNSRHHIFPASSPYIPRAMVRGYVTCEALGCIGSCDSRLPKV